MGPEKGRTVASDTLREELLAVPGVASAEVDVSGTDPAGVKVRLEPDADAEVVGVEVQRVLASHGMKSRLSGADAVAGTAMPPAEPAAAVEPEPEPEPAASTEAEPAAEAPLEPEVLPEPPPPPAEVAPVVPMAAVPDQPQSAPPAAAASAGLVKVESVAVHERADSLAATVRLTDGSEATGPPVADASQLEATIAAGAITALGSTAELAAVEWMVVDGESIVTVVVRDGKGLDAGAAVVGTGRAFAVASATAAALGS